MKKTFHLLVLVILSLILSACRDTVAVESIEIEGPTIVNLGESLALNAKLFPEIASQEVNWSSSDKSIATISKDGIIENYKTGKVTIKASSKQNSKVFEEIIIYVIDFKIKGPKKVKQGDTAKFVADFGISGFIPEVRWNISNSELASIDTSGLLETSKMGTLNISATLKRDPTKITTYSINITKEDNDSFNALMDELFLYFIGEDPMNINFILYYPEKYNLNDVEVKSYIYSIEAEEAYFNELKEIKASLLSFDDDDLSDNQILDKKVLLDYLGHKLAYEGFYYYGSELGSYLGYQAQLPIVLAEYRFDDLSDIENYFDYLRLCEEVFLEIINFEKEKASLGMGLTDVIIDRIVEQCDDFINEPENYLIPVFISKLEELDFLDEEAKLDLINTNTTLVENDFINAYISLRDELLLLKGQNPTSGALANYEDGAAYYEVLFQDRIGTNMSIPEVIDFLEDLIAQLFSEYYRKPYAYGNHYRLDLMQGMELNDLLPFFLETMAQDFPEISILPEYKIKEIHPSLQDHASPAMYFLSPLDGNKEESIYINPKNFKNNDNYTYQTMAHEGLPGHLYQHLYLKNTNLPLVRKNISITGYAEAWAIYIENYVLKYVDKANKQDVFDAFEFYDSITYLILGRADIGINYEGWTFKEAKSYLDTYFNLDADEVTLEEIYYDLTEVPTNYLSYYFSYYQIKNFKLMFKELMQDEYSDYIFHKIYLDTGPCSLDILQEEYIKYATEHIGS